MSAFSQARTVEARALILLLPYLKERAHDGQLVLCNKGPLAKFLQETTGDAIFNSDADTIWTVEIKAEERHTGNLFIETWSNRNLESRPSHSERGSNRGWLDKLRSDLLFYYFLDTDDLYIINLFRLKQWAFGANGSPGQIYAYPEVPQAKYSQANDTWGRLVPLKDIAKEFGYKHARPRQIALFDEVTS